jgi:hypothetical protein
MAQAVPDEPNIESVSIDPLTGHVTITWLPMSPPVSTVQTDGYRIYWLQLYPSITNHQIADIPDPTARSYTFDIDTMVVSVPPMPDPRKTTVPFTVAAYSNTPPSTSLRSEEDYNMQLTGSYDSCRAEIKLNWYPYRGWYQNGNPPKPLICYRVMRIPDGGGPHEEVKILPDQDTAYTMPRIEENQRYSFYIVAERSDGFKVTSYKKDFFTQMPVRPTFIEAEGVQYDSQGIAEITFKLDANSQTHSYELLGSSRPDYSFVSLSNMDNITGDRLVVSDFQPREKTFYYKLAAWHVCKNKYTVESNTTTALWLTLKQDDQINTLQWDAYSKWSVSPTYDIYRRIGSDPEEVIVQFSATDGTTYKDDVTGKQFDGDICYWIQAVPESGGTADQKSVSNSICLQPESDIFIPQAFTPNSSNPVNAGYKPFFSYEPVEYIMFLYDRSGAKIFETRNTGDAWDGRLKNGKPANEGVYLYYIKYRTVKGRLIEKRGTFLLVLP